MRAISNLFLLILVIASCNSKQSDKVDKLSTVETDDRIVIVGGTTAEIVSAVGLESQIVGVDRTSTYPERLQSLPSVGYRNSIKAEGILSLNPTLILLENEYVDQVVLEQLKSSGIKTVVLDKPNTTKEAISYIEKLGALLDKKVEANQLIEKLQSDLAAAQESLETYQNDSLSAAFVMARGKDMIFLAGQQTFVDEMFALAGLQKTEVEFQDFKPLTPEALIKLNPDYVVFFESGLQSIGGMGVLPANKRYL